MHLLKAERYYIFKAAAVASDDMWEKVDLRINSIPTSTAESDREKGGKGKGVNKGQSKLKQGTRSYTVILIHQNCPKRSISNRKNWVGMNSNTTKGSC